MAKAKEKAFEVVMIPREGEPQTFTAERPAADEQGNPAGVEEYERPILRNITVMAESKDDAKQIALTQAMDIGRQNSEPAYEIAEVKEA